MRMRFFICCLAASASSFVPALVVAQEPDALAAMKQLQASISIINAELRSDLEQMLMLQEALRINAGPPLEVQGRSPDVVQYEDAAAAQRRALERETAINARLDAILARSADLEAKKAALLERMYALEPVPPGGEEPSEGAARLR